jgi:hypothetical protein
MRNASAKQGGFGGGFAGGGEGATLQAESQTLLATMPESHDFVTFVTVLTLVREGREGFFRLTRMRAVFQEEKNKSYRGNLGRPSLPSTNAQRVARATAFMADRLEATAQKPALKTSSRGNPYCQVMMVCGDGEVKPDVPHAEEIFT